MICWSVSSSTQGSATWRLAVEKLVRRQTQANARTGEAETDQILVQRYDLVDFPLIDGEPRPRTGSAKIDFAVFLHEFRVMGLDPRIVFEPEVAILCRSQPELGA